MFKIISLLLAIAMTVYSAEISSSYAMLEKHAMFNPEPKSDAMLNEAKPDVAHPVYREEIKNQGRARIEPVRSLGPVVKHDTMLADPPAAPTEVNRVGDLGNGYNIPGPAEVTYPDIPYAPGYYYDTAVNDYDMYGSNTYQMEPTSTFDLLWSQVPYGRTLVSYVGRTIMWIFNSIFILFLGSILTVGVCSYTNLCTIAFNGVGPIHEEMRTIITPDRLEKIGNAANFVKTAIDKYQEIQKVTDESSTTRRRRALFNF